MISGALLSEDRKYRYLLRRMWDPDGPVVGFICLNPSTADETEDDPTVRRLIRFAQSWGFGGFWLGNLFAYRATDPRELKLQRDPIGPENDKILTETHAVRIVGAWGNGGLLYGRGDEVRQMLPHLTCLGVTNQGQPKHPLYLPNGSLPMTYEYAFSKHPLTLSSGKRTTVTWKTLKGVEPNGT